MKLSRNIKKALLLLFSTAVFLFILFKSFVQFSDFAGVIGDAKISFLLYALAIGFTGPVLSTYRYKMVLLLSGFNVPFKKILSVIMASWPLTILPGRAGDFTKSYPLRREISPSVTIAATIFERVTDVATLLLISAFGLYYLNQTLYAALLLLAALALLPAVFIFKNFLKYLPNFIEKNLELLWVKFSFKNLHSKYFYIALLTSLTNWLASMAEVWLLFRAFGAEVNIYSVLTYLPLALFIGLVPITIAGMGTRDSAIIAFFANQSAPAVSLATGIGYTFLGYFLFAILGIPFLIKEYGSLFMADNDAGHPTP